jgi:hypothetical protein
MQYIECTATGAKLEVTDAPAMAAGFADVFAVRCSFDDAWNGLDSRVASFRVTGSKPTSVVEVDGAFTVPPEVNAGPSFDFAISGTAGDGRRITTNAVTVTVASSVPVGDEAGDPTPSVSAQALEAAQTAAEAAADALAKASQALTEAANALAAATEAASKADTAKSAADAVVATAEAAQTAAEAAAAKAIEATAAVAPATASTLGTIMVGDGLSVTDEGVLSAEGGGTGEVADGSITTAKLADKAVTSYKVMNGQIGAWKMDNEFWGQVWPVGSVWSTANSADNPNRMTQGMGAFAAQLGFGKISAGLSSKVIAKWESLGDDGTGVYRWKRTQ